MTIEIGGTSLPPVYPTQLLPDPNSGEGEPSGSTEGSSSSGGPDAVYEPSAPDDGEPLTYSFPPGTTSSGIGDESAGDAGLEGAEGSGEGGGDPYMSGTSGSGESDPSAEQASGGEGVDGSSGDPVPDEGSTDPYAQGASGDGAVDPYASTPSGDGGESEPGDVGAAGDGSGDDPYADYGATDGGDGSFDYDASGNGSGDGAIEPNGESGSEDGGVDPYAGQAGDEGSGDPYSGYGATDGGEVSFDYGASGDGSGDGSVDPYAEGGSEDGSVDPYAEEAGDGETNPYADGTLEEGAIDPDTGLPVNGGGGDTSEIGGENEEQSQIAAQQPSGPDTISTAAHRDAIAHASAAAEAARPSLSAALGQGQTHSSLAEQIQAFAPIQPRPVRQVRQQPSPQAGKLAAAIQDAAVQTRISKGRASLMAQAAYAMIGDAQSLDRSKLSLIDKLG